MNQLNKKTTSGDTLAFLAYCMRKACCFSSGSIFSSTFENFTLALTHSAKGAAAAEARLAFLGSKDSCFILRMFSTASRSDGSIVRASKFLKKSNAKILLKITLIKFYSKRLSSTLFLPLLPVLKESFSYCSKTCLGFP
jgi:hypothetical protein